MEFRKIFDTIPEQFDKWHPRYCAPAFAAIAEYAQLNSAKSVLEIGPGTGQATQPILETGCQYLGIELGEHLAAFTGDKFRRYSNFRLINDDFETHDFGGEIFDLIYSAATIQWIPEQIGFSRASQLLRRGGAFAMMFLRGDYQTPNPALYAKIQKVYEEFFHPEQPYRQKLIYENVTNYGFSTPERREYHSNRMFTADNYIAYLGTHCDHIGLKEPDRSKFFDGIRQAILEEGNQLLFNDTTVLYLTRKI